MKSASTLFGLALVVGLFASLKFSQPAAAAEADSRVYEMRVYYAAEGKLDDLQARFRNHTLKLFEKHGISNIGYWVPIDNPESKLIYFLAYPSRESRETSWSAFKADPEWQKAQKASEVNGKLVAKVESRFLKATDFSPVIQPSNVGNRVFEMRTYTASPNNLPDLLDRFRNHTVSLFEKHGMTNVAYWTLMDDQPHADATLIYILAHESQAKAKDNFAEFGKDPDWQAARKASEEKAGGSLTIKKGVESVFMQATDYSPIR